METFCSSPRAVRGVFPPSEVGAAGGESGSEVNSANLRGDFFFARIKKAYGDETTISASVLQPVEF